MTHSRREKLCAVAAVLAAGYALSLAACTPATSDEPAAGGAPPTPGAGAVGMVSAGSGNSPTSGGAPGAGGADQPGSAGAGNPTSGGAPPAGGGAPPAGGGAPPAGGGASPAGGGAPGAAGAGVGAGGAAPAGTGCNWVHAANDTWSMNPAPADKVVLFDGKDLSQWHRLNMPGTPAQWTVLPDGWMQVVPQPTPTNIQSNAKFDDVCLHVEYITPTFASGVGVQMQGNSGVYLKSAYEMQVLDTSKLGPLIDGCGAVYKVSPPLVVACNQFGISNTYEIEFKGSVWNAAGVKTKSAVFVQVALNGKLVQQNVTLNPAGGFTEAGIPDVAGPQPIALQDHREPVKYHNVWVTIPHY